jgi:hypothetical protein
MFQMIIKYKNIFHSKALQNVQKGIFGFKINNLATLSRSQSYDGVHTVRTYVQRNKRGQCYYFWYFRGGKRRKFFAQNTACYLTTTVDRNIGFQDNFFRRKLCS